VVFNILTGIAEALDAQVIQSFLVGFDVLLKDALLILNPVAMLNFGSVSKLIRRPPQSKESENTKYRSKSAAFAPPID
jgi:hypothetical protein